MRALQAAPLPLTKLATIFSSLIPENTFMRQSICVKYNLVKFSIDILARLILIFLNIVQLEVATESCPSMNAFYRVPSAIEDLSDTRISCSRWTNQTNNQPSSIPTSIQSKFNQELNKPSFQIAIPPILLNYDIAYHINENCTI